MAISIAPSQWWEGDDGPWSSFAIQIGTPPQTVRVLPSTSQSSIWVVLPEGCQAPGDPSDCATLRGLLYEPGNSTTYSRTGDDNQFFELPFDPEASLGYSGNSIVGFDNVTLGWEGSTSPILKSQVITGFAVKQPFLGIFGLTPRPVNLTSFVDQHSSVLGSLVANETIPSASFGYTAGAKYRQPEAYGSLTLGGFDTARGNVDHVLNVPFGINTYRDLLVAIKSIGISQPGGTTTTQGVSVLAYIDSTVPEIWLPTQICQAFETAFNLTWNETFSMYLVDEDLHTRLSASAPSVVFTLAASTDDDSPTTTITLPYASFDLTATFPVAGLQPNASQRYFPLKRAQNDSQYTLGRTFLQEAYLGVDYDRSVFNISQATFPSNGSVSSLQTILPPAASGLSHLSGGTIAGIVIGIVAFGVLLFASWKLWRREQAKKRAAESQAMISDDSREEMTQRTNYGGSYNLRENSRLHVGPHIGDQINNWSCFGR